MVSTGINVVVCDMSVCTVHVCMYLCMYACTYIPVLVADLITMYLHNKQYGHAILSLLTKKGYKWYHIWYTVCDEIYICVYSPDSGAAHLYVFLFSYSRSEWCLACGITLSFVTSLLFNNSSLTGWRINKNILDQDSALLIILGDVCSCFRVFSFPLTLSSNHLCVILGQIRAVQAGPCFTDMLKLHHSGCSEIAEGEPNVSLFLSGTFTLGD